MDGVLPISFSLGDAAESIGQQMQQGLTPFLEQMNSILQRRGDELSRIGFGVMTLVFGTLGLIQGLQLGVQSVQVVNLGFLEIMGAGSFAFLVLIFLKLFDIEREIRSLHRCMSGVIKNFLWVKLEALWISICDRIVTCLTMVLNVLLSISIILKALLEVTLKLLADIAIKLQAGLSVDGAFSFTLDLKGLGDIGLLELTLKMFGLAAAATALAVALGLLIPALTVMSGVLALLAGGLALLALALGLMPDNLQDIVNALLWLGAGLIVLGAAIAIAFATGTLVPIIAGLAAILVFLAILAGVLHLMPDNLDDIAKGLLKLYGGLILLGAAIALLGADKFKQVALGLLAIGVFLLLVGVALRLFNEASLAAIPALNELFEAVIALVNALAEIEEDSFKKIAIGLLGIVVFLGLLGLALRLFNAEVLEAIPGLKDLFEGLIALATAITEFDEDQLRKIGIGFLGIVVFLGLLGLALRLFNTDVLNAIPGLRDLFDGLVKLAETIANFSIDQMIQIAIGLAGIVVFLFLLSLAINNFNADVLNALPALSELLNSLGNLMTTIAGFSVEELILIGVALAILTAFMFGLGVALNIATPGLNAMASVLSSMESLLNTAAEAAGNLADAISSIPSLPSLPDFDIGISDLIPSFQTGGIMPHTGLAYLHAGERVLNVEETQAFNRGARSGDSLLTASPTPTSGSVDQSLHLGGINITINADRLDGDSANILSDEIVQQLRAKLANLQTEENFRTGVRSSALA